MKEIKSDCNKNILTGTKYIMWDKDWNILKSFTSGLSPTEAATTINIKRNSEEEKTRCLR